MRTRWLFLGVAASIAVMPLACDELGDDCTVTKTCETGGAGPGGGTTSNTGGSTTTNGGGGQGGVGGSTPTCTDDPTLCTDQGLVCHEGACVECAPGDDEGCTGETPWCNPATLACEACRYHEHCPGSACNVFTGACLDATPVEVGTNETDLATAIGEAGNEAVLLVEPRPGDAAYALNNVGIGAKSIAILGHSGRPLVTGQGGFPTLSIASGATLLLEGVDLRGNTSSRALQADGLVALDRVEIAQNSGGGISAGSTAELLVRNSIIAGNGQQLDEDAVVLNGTTATILYSTIAGLVLDPSAAVSCSGNYELTIRNSILLKRHGSGSALVGCSNAAASTSHDDSIDQSTGMSWFAGWATNLRLTAAGKTQFADVALWQPGDPPTDIDGQPRPTSEGPDVAGAHLGP